MDGSPMMHGVAGDNPQAENSDGSPAGSSWYMRNISDVASELNTIHAANASCAAYHADVAAKHAASLASWVQYLYDEIAQLQTKVVELEDWKQKTLNDMNRLRFEHKQIRDKLSPRDSDEALGLPPKSKSLPLLLADHVDPDSEAERRGRKAKADKGAALGATMRPPPGLEIPLEKGGGPETPDKSKSVRFAPPMAAPPVTPAAASACGSNDGASAATPDTPEGFGVPRCFSALSEVSHISDVPDEGVLEGVSVAPAFLDGDEAEVAVWRIGHLSAKLKGCMGGRPLVSSPFSMCGLQDLRLMVFPDGKDAAKGPRSRRQKELFAKKVSEGPLDGCLKLKVPDCPAPHILEYYLKIGSCRQGLFKHNFSENTVNGCMDFGVDWLTQVEADQSLTVTVEVLKRGAVANARSTGAGIP